MFYWSESFTSLIRFWQPQFDGLTRLTLTPLDFRFYDRSTPLHVTIGPALPLICPGGLFRHPLLSFQPRLFNVPTK